MFERLQRAFEAWRPSDVPTTYTVYYWRCTCGAHSRQGDIQSDTEYNAQRHQWSKGVDHPMPEVYGVEEPA